MLGDGSSCVAPCPCAAELAVGLPRFERLCDYASSVRLSGRRRRCRRIDSRWQSCCRTRSGAATRETLASSKRRSTTPSSLTGGCGCTPRLEPTWRLPFLLSMRIPPTSSSASLSSSPIILREMGGRCGDVLSLSRGPRWAGQGLSLTASALCLAVS